MNLTHLTAGSALLIVLVGFLTVFAVLCLIAGCITLNSRVIRKLEDRKKPETGDSDDQEFIQAAIAAYLGTTPEQIRIRSIREIHQQ